MRYHSWKPLLDMHTTLSICDSDRDIGKSFPMMMRAIKRAWKRGASMLWLRRTEKEYMNLLRTFPGAKWNKVCKLVGVPVDALSRKGDYITVKRPNGETVNAIHYGALSEYMALRDTDEPNLELIYIDEAFASVERLRAYRGNEVANAMDILKTMRRDNRDVRMIIAGNREAIATPWYDYFGVKRPEIEAGRVYLTTPSGERIAFERARKGNPDPKFMSLVAGTGYGAFMKGDDKGYNSALIEVLIPKAVHYCNVDFGKRLSIWRQNGHFVFSTAFHKEPPVRDKPSADGGLILTPQLKKRFVLLREAYRRDGVRFASKESYIAGLQALQKLI